MSDPVLDRLFIVRIRDTLDFQNGRARSEFEQPALELARLSDAHPLIRTHHVDAERVLIEVVKRVGTVAQRGFREVGEARLRHHDVLDDYDRAVQRELIRELKDRRPLADVQPRRDFLRGFRFTEVDEAHGGVGLVAVVAHDAKEAEEMPVALMHRNEGAKALVPDQYVLSAQFVDRLAQRADRNAEAFRETFFRRNRLATLPLVRRQRRQQRVLDFLVPRAANGGRRLRHGAHGSP
ncbi:hypothetical protein KCU90_g5688, partial [Aureobasidium melanogenum]